jgi:hypothetical protein
MPCFANLGAYQFPGELPAIPVMKASWANPPLDGSGCQLAARTTLIGTIRSGLFSLDIRVADDAAQFVILFV